MNPRHLTLIAATAILFPVASLIALHQAPRPPVVPAQPAALVHRAAASELDGAALRWGVAWGADMLVVPARRRG